jgi:threonine dehydrogenase-like Zn-dependent dehydrogenase
MAPARAARKSPVAPAKLWDISHFDVRKATMKALVIDGPHSLLLKEVAPPTLDGTCKIRVSMAGICGTDLQLLEGYAGFRGIPGHEFVGVVEEAPAADREWIGRRVVGEINVGCNRCRWCAVGIKEHCVDRTVVGIRGRDGAFAELLSLPAVNLHHVPDAVDDQTAVFTEPTAAACRILEQMEIHRTARIAVVGDGRMGLIVAQVLRSATPDVTVVGRHEKKLDIARSLGLAATSAGEPPQDRFDVVVDVTGRPEGMRRALELVRPRGTVVMKSTFHGEAALATWPIVVDEITMVGSRCGPFRPALELLASGAVQVRPLISRIMALDDYEAAFAEARRAVKILIQPVAPQPRRGAGG